MATSDRIVSLCKRQKCCDPYKLHEKRVTKGLRKVSEKTRTIHRSLHFEFDDHLCTSCRKRVAALAEDIPTVETSAAEEDVQEAYPRQNGAVDEVAAKPAAKGRGRPKKAAGTTKAAKKAAANPKAAYDGPKRGRGRPKVAEVEDDAASAEDQEEEDEPQVKKAKSSPAPKKAAVAGAKGRGRPKKV